MCVCWGGVVGGLREQGRVREWVDNWLGDGVVMEVGKCRNSL